MVSQLGLEGSVRLGLGLVTSLRLQLKVRVSVSIRGGSNKPGFTAAIVLSMLLWWHLLLQKYRAYLVPKIRKTSDVTFMPEISLNKYLTLNSTDISQ